ncbi:uncharacterized protein B0H18DRAFT_961322 [Fomitopsis serialis]|uniref:uncharacterized protein n=1 Tax=Fomitopsis serialis TaxID=139415 RepID=UPI00200870E1|nr:uncharacterized protein B0H18DRAFT_961322 [Neoantrodia serialis]KAH9912167.1 hypothetical protein B0H18DRAFT_961322 [Neoantrodia serialis]
MGLGTDFVPQDIPTLHEQTFLTSLRQEPLSDSATLFMNDASNSTAELPNSATLFVNEPLYIPTSFMDDVANSTADATDSTADVVLHRSQTMHPTALQIATLFMNNEADRAVSFMNDTSDSSEDERKDCKSDPTYPSPRHPRPAQRRCDLHQQIATNAVAKRSVMDMRAMKHLSSSPNKETGKHIM